VKIGIENHSELVQSVTAEPERYNDLTDEQRDFIDLSQSAGAWAMICGCVKPYIKLDEWLTLGDESIDAISSAVIETNPHWFSTPEKEKKTEAEPMTSTSE